MSQHFTPGRIVAALTPTVFAPLAGLASIKLADIGLDVSTEQLQTIFIAGATIALAPALLWLKGWQDYEKRQAAVNEGVSNDLRLEEATAARSAGAEAALDPDAGGALDGFELEADDDFAEELLADGLDEDIDELDDELDPADNGLLLGSGRE